MAQWLSRVKLKHLLNDDYDPDDCDPESELEEIPLIARRIAHVIRNSSAFFAAGYLATAFEQCQTEAQLNRVLASMYDFADKHRIWIE